MQSRSGLSVLYAITSDGVLMTFDLSSLSEEDVDLASETCRLRSMISLNVPSSRNWSRCSILPLDSYLILMNPRHTTVSILSTSNHEQKLSPILVGEFDFFDLFNYYSTDNSSDMHHFDVLPYSVEMAQSAEKSVRDSLVIAYPINGRILSFQTKSSLPYPLEFSLAERIFM